MKALLTNNILPHLLMSFYARYITNNLFLKLKRACTLNQWIKFINHICHLFKSIMATILNLSSIKQISYNNISHKIVKTCCCNIIWTNKIITWQKQNLIIKHHLNHIIIWLWALINAQKHLTKDLSSVHSKISL